MFKILFSIALLSAMTGLLSAASICDGDINNLVKNCGFETGDFTDWTVAYAASGSFLTVDTFDPNSGSYDASFGASDSEVDTITQTLATIAGDSYAFSFYLFDRNEQAGLFQADFDGNQELDVTTAPGSYQQYIFDVTASTDSTVIQFDGYNAAARFVLDDVQVDDLGPAVPEPASFLLAGFGLAAASIGLYLRRGR
jgi:hypothetical protein